MAQVAEGDSGLVHPLSSFSVRVKDPDQMSGPGVRDVSPHNRNIKKQHNLNMEDCKSSIHKFYLKSR